MKTKTTRIRSWPAKCGLHWFRRITIYAARNGAIWNGRPVKRTRLLRHTWKVVNVTELMPDKAVYHYDSGERREVAWPPDKYHRYEWAIAVPPQ